MLTFRFQTGKNWGSVRNADQRRPPEARLWPQGKNSYCVQWYDWNVWVSDMQAAGCLDSLWCFITTRKVGFIPSLWSLRSAISLKKTPNLVEGSNPFRSTHCLPWSLWWQGSHCGVTLPRDSKLSQLTFYKTFHRKPASHHEQKPLSPLEGQLSFPWHLVKAWAIITNIR